MLFFFQGLSQHIYELEQSVEKIKSELASIFF